VQVKWKGFLTDIWPVVTEDELELVCDISNGIISSDPEWPVGLTHISRSRQYSTLNSKCQ